jgi:hypothetical protein
VQEKFTEVPTVVEKPVVVVEKVIEPYAVMQVI